MASAGSTGRLKLLGRGSLRRNFVSLIVPICASSPLLPSIQKPSCLLWASMESTALFDEISGVHEKISKCAVCSA